MKNIFLFVILFSAYISNCYSQNWLWAKNAGGTDSDNAYSVSTDISGNLFVTGGFESPTITFGSIVLSNSDTFGFSQNVFVAKYDSNGNVLWAKSAGEAANNEWGFSISPDLGGNVFVTGVFYSPTITFDSVTLTNTGVSNVFIVKYDANGNVLWAKSAAGTSNDRGFAVSADIGGNVFVTGWFTSPTITFGSVVLTNAGTGFAADLFIAKYDANGNVLWAKSVGGTASEAGTSLSTDATGNVFITGWFFSPSITLGAITLSKFGPYTCDIFLAKYDASGNVLWAKSAGGNEYDRGNSINVDLDGNVFVTGIFMSPTIVFDTTTLTNLGDNDVFIAKYDKSGNVLWAKSAGGISYDAGFSISTDFAGNAFVTGNSSSSIINFDSAILTNISGQCAFVAKYDANGNVVCTSALANGGSNGISIDPLGNVFVGGGFYVNPFIIGSDTLLTKGGGDVFVAKYLCDDNVITKVNDGSTALSKTNVFPNPSLGIFTVDLKNKSVEADLRIYGILGNCLLNKVCKKDASFIIDLSIEPKGIYFMEIVSDGEREVKKIVLQ